LGHIENIFVN